MIHHAIVPSFSERAGTPQHITPGTVNVHRRGISECLPVESTSETAERSPEGAAYSVRCPDPYCTPDGATIMPGLFVEHCRGNSNSLPDDFKAVATERSPEGAANSVRCPAFFCTEDGAAGPGHFVEHCRGISNRLPVVPADVPTARVPQRGTKSDRIPAHYSTHVGAQVPTAKIHEIIATGPFERRFKALWHDLFYKEIPTGQGHHHFCALRDKDVKALLQAKTIRIPAPGEYESLEDTCSVFIVPEHPKQRVRVITWTKDTNDIVYESEFSLKTPREVILESHGAVAALILDLAAALYQFAIPQSQQWRFAFSFRGTRYVFTKLPMGARQSAELCNIFLSSILHLAGAYENGAKVTVHIDNARIIGSHDHVQTVRQRCMEICALYRVIFGEIIVAQQLQNPLYDFLGVRYDMGEGTITIPPSKQQRLWIFFREHLHTWSTRHRSTKTEATPRYVATRREIVSLVSKTSAHLASHDHTLFHSVVWHKALTINQAELAIILAAIRKWLPKLKGGTLVIATDSQVAIQAITNGRSDTPEIDKLAKRICKRLAEAHITVVFKKVYTKKNPMDAPSRAKAMKWQSLLEHFTQCMEEGIFEERGASPSE
jgi:ribonuclease HI